MMIRRRTVIRTVIGGPFYVYILASRSRCLYVGVTNGLRRRLLQHRTFTPEAFTSRYRITRLVYFEHTFDARSAITREKQLKRWPRRRKERLIERSNPEWRDLSDEWPAASSPPGE